MAAHLVGHGRGAIATRTVQDSGLVLAATFGVAPLAGGQCPRGRVRVHANRQDVHLENDWRSERTHLAQHVGTYH